MDITGKTPKELLSNYYKENDFGDDGGMSSATVKIKLTPKIHLYFPNFDSRRKAVLRHDIHHLITEYKTDLNGESEISAWEIGSGCKKYWAAFLLDTSGLMLGILLNFRGVLKAFSRGRKTKNLYWDLMPLETVMDMELGEIRSQLLLDQHTIDIKPGLLDLIYLSIFVVFGLFYSFFAFALIPFLIFYTIYIDLKIKLTA